MLSLLGASGGAVVGALCTAGYAVLRDWPVVIPLDTLSLGVIASFAVGVPAGINSECTVKAFGSHS
ncbi:hypothetical protein OG613_45840 (plasmid) [Streptomyces sp. NBC_00015]|uniref:Uncharacterized protein n=1 Tax=Streptomyces rishiriensis TaxID=68264 RepID=A0ABU0NGI5_STRRH|nr:MULTISPECIES: hypothetical protein [Streptomyces]MDQ0578222.1 hypothetical protein [Streptomyces rishiriensis]MDR6980880.1 hypothetical protein [Streptomyces sp. 3330]